jgi:hypothetical protein
MGDSDLEGRSTEVLLEEKNTYSVISYPGIDLPEEFRGLVLDYWRKSLRRWNDFFRLIDGKTFFDAYNPYLVALLNRPHAVVRLAVLTDDLHNCLGFSVSEPDVLHYVWVRPSAQGIGVMTALIQFPFSTITHLTRHGMQVWNKKFPHVKFNPFK